MIEKTTIEALGKTVIRQAALEDAARISELVTACYRRFAVTDNYSPAVVEDVISRRGTQDSIVELMQSESVFAAEQAGQMLGMVSVSDNEITKLYVRPDAQKQGIGTLLFRRAEAVIQTNGFADMFLGVAVSSARGFYDKMGMSLLRQKHITHGPCKGQQTDIMQLSWKNERN